jgi:ADP-ribose pyrophosphatase YjhB (NUDIX family)
MQKGVDFIGVTISFICHDGKGNYLMEKRGKNCRDEHGVWDFGGGGLEMGETAEVCLKKEVKEEYGTDVLEHEFLGYRDIHREHNDKKTHWITLDFKVLIDKEKVKNGEPHKFDAVEWFTLETLPSPIHSQLPMFLEKYKDKL